MDKQHSNVFQSVHFLVRFITYDSVLVLATSPKDLFTTDKTNLRENMEMSKEWKHARSRP
jgi:hypothetical protein